MNEVKITSGEPSELNELENFLIQLETCCKKIKPIINETEIIIDDCNTEYDEVEKFIEREISMLNANRKVTLTLFNPKTGERIAVMMRGKYKKTEPANKDGFVFENSKAILMIDEIKHRNNKGFGIKGEYDTTDKSLYEDKTGVRFFLGSKPSVTADKKFTVKVNGKEFVCEAHQTYNFEYLNERVKYILTTDENKVIHFTLEEK
jgi:hypothetical protein